MNYKIKSDDFKNVFEENRFPNITEVRLDYDWDNEGSIDDLIAEVANSCPNVKKFVIRTEYPSTVKSFKAILTKCKKLEIFKLISVGNYKLPSEIENVFPDICRNWPNLRYLELTDWKLSRKQGRYLIVHCDQLQAVISGKSLFVKSSAQMSEVATFFDEWVYHEFIICNKIFVH
jgi:Ran GTPase-activating protein (RanGAP) involved in mRNA processing and transport